MLYTEKKLAKEDFINLISTSVECYLKIVFFMVMYYICRTVQVATSLK